MRKNTLIIFGAIILVVCIFGGWGFFQGKSVPKTEQPSEVSDVKENEESTLKLIRLGALDWQMACAWSMGRESKGKMEMFKACSVDYHIGQPDWHRFSHP